MNRLRQLKQDLLRLADPRRAAAATWYFKTGKGQYGEGDVFIGITVPLQRRVALRNFQLSFTDLGKLLSSKIHEHRFVALEILVARYEKGSKQEQKEIYNFYLAHTDGINNWDLVDTSAHYIVGEYLVDHPRGILKKLAASKNVWERRIAIVSTFAFIRREDLSWSFALAEKLLGDTHELIQKAVGWVLRVAGSVDKRMLLLFLKKHAAAMPRTMLRIAIEKFPEAERKRLFGQRG